MKYTLYIAAMFALTAGSTMADGTPAVSVILARGGESGSDQVKR